MKDAVREVHTTRTVLDVLPSYRIAGEEERVIGQQWAVPIFVGRVGNILVRLSLPLPLHPDCRSLQPAVPTFSHAPGQAARSLVRLHTCTHSPPPSSWCGQPRNLTHYCPRSSLADALEHFPIISQPLFPPPNPLPPPSRPSAGCNGLLIETGAAFARDRPSLSRRRHSLPSHSWFSHGLHLSSLGSLSTVSSPTQRLFNPETLPGQHADHSSFTLTLSPSHPPTLSVEPL
jgi:hypothetical protein